MTTNYSTKGDGLLENFLSKKRARIADKLILPESRNGRLLDIGCGKFPFFIVNTQFHQKYGIDSLIENSNLKGNIYLKKFKINPNTKLPFEDNFFDVITMLAVLEHLTLNEINNILKEIKRILKPGGKFILTTPCSWTKNLLLVMSKLKLVSSQEIQEHKTFFNPNSLINHLINAGFEKNKIKTGYFELFLNSWTYVDK